jgi:8-oxo-dGTP diphosphatase
MENKKPGVGFGVMLLRGNKILLGKRHEDPAKADSALHGAGTWTMPGGKLEFKETFEDGAYRETLEETGIEIDKNLLEHISTTNNIVEDAHFVTLGFLCRKFSGEAKVREPDEITEWQWFDLGNLPSPLYFPSRQIIEKFLKNNLQKL